MLDLLRNSKDKWRNLKNRVRIMEKSKTQTLKSASVSNSLAKTSPVVISNEPSPSSSSDMSNESRFVTFGDSLISFFL